VSELNDESLSDHDYTLINYKTATVIIPVTIKILIISFEKEI